MKFWMKFWKEEEGQDLVELGLILALVSVVCLATLGTMGGDINTVFGKVNGSLGGA